MHRGNPATTVTVAPPDLASDRDDDDEFGMIPQPEVQLNRAAIRDWIGAYRRRGTQIGVLKTCALNCPNPPSRVPWRPWHPAMSLLCSHHRAMLYDLASASADRYQIRAERILTDLLNLLIRLDREMDRDVN